MPRSAKGSISLPEQLLGDIEETRRLYGESRSQFFRRAAEVLIGAQRQQELDEQYIAAYRAIPEVVDEGLYQAGLAAIAQEPWEEEEPQ